MTSFLSLSLSSLLSAPYVNYIRKDPGAPCSLTEALEYLQVDVLADLMEKDQQSINQKQPPKNKPHNVTVVAMEGCHSFVILDWALPLKNDMVSGEWKSVAVPVLLFKNAFAVAELWKIDFCKSKFHHNVW